MISLNYSIWGLGCGEKIYRFPCLRPFPSAFLSSISDFDCVELALRFGYRAGMTRLKLGVRLGNLYYVGTSRNTVTIWIDLDQMGKKIVVIGVAKNQVRKHQDSIPAQVHSQ